MYFTAKNASFKIASLMRYNEVFRGVLLCVFLFLGTVNADESITFPKKFHVQYQSLSNGSLFHVVQGSTPFAKVIREKNGTQERFVYQTLDNQLIAAAVFEKQGTHLDAKINGPNKEQVGWLSAKIYAYYPTDLMLYAHNNLLIAAGSMNWIGNRFVLTDPHNSHVEYAIFSRSPFKFQASRWYVEIMQEGKVDPGIMVIIGAYQASLNLGLEG